MSSPSIRFSHAAPDTEMPVTDLTLPEYEQKCERDLAVQKKEFRAPSDDSEAFLAPWKKRLACRNSAILIYTDPKAAAGGDGSEKHPFATLAEAQKQVRVLLKKHPALPITVRMHGGVYPFQESLHFGKKDSGTPESPVVWENVSGEKVVFSGSRTIRSFRKVTDPAVLARLPEKSRDQVLVADLRENGVDRVPPLPLRGMGLNGYPATPWTECYSGGRRMTLARWPKKNEPQLHTGRILSGNATSTGVEIVTPKEHTVFEFSSPRTARWKLAEDLRADGQWSYLWASESRLVEKLLPDRVQLNPPHRYGCREGFPFFFFNLLEELSEPGEFFLDRKTLKLYCIPFDPPEDPESFTADLTDFPDAFLIAENLSDAVFRGFTITGGSADGIFLQNCERVFLSDLEIHLIGGGAATAADVKQCGFFQCHVHHTGGSGIHLIGGDRKKLIPAENFIINLHVHHIGEVDRSYAPPVVIGGCGNSVLHVHMHHLPHNGITVGGDHETVAFVDGHDLVRDFDDLAGIDCGFDPYLYDVRFFWNYWHDVGSLAENTCGQSGIRLDDATGHILIYGNIFHDCARKGFGGLQVHAGKNNVIENNLFLACRRALSFSSWTPEFWEFSLEHKLPREFGCDPERQKLVSRHPEQPEDRTRNFAVGNLMLNCGDMTGYNGTIPVYQYFRDNLSLQADSLADFGFRDAEHNDFSLNEDSVLRKLAPEFKEIPFARIGILPELADGFEAR